MPIRGQDHTELVFEDSRYFKSLSELDEWSKTPRRKHRAIVPYVPRPLTANTRGKLLVCHDYKGGYTESPSGKSYTFNFWSLCDTFIYFSHHRVTIPPSGWITAAHRHGVKMLGTLIFEGDGEPDCLRLLVGALPSSPTGPAVSSANTSFPISPHYARTLALLASQRGFDGYLLNFECPLRGGLEQTRALTAWIAMLERELQAQVGAHAQVIWYDSVVVTSQLRWQDRLNSLNLPFFLPSSGFFTNYTWPPSHPSATAQYFLGLDPAHLSVPKTLQDIWVGVDVWGRGQHGGGGLGCYRAINHIDPEFLGLSVALFGQAWTWESEQDLPGWTWEAWWRFERTLWLGPQREGEAVPVPVAARRPQEPECPHGPFTPLSTFFVRQTPPNPLDLPFFTAFSPGVGTRWFVRGTQVLETEKGWTDVDKNTSVGDLVFPRPTLAWEAVERDEPVPGATADLTMDDAWLGGSSLVVSLSAPGSDAEDAFFRCVWLPIQSLSITPRKQYRMSIIYKTTSTADLDVGASIKALSDDAGGTFSIDPLPAAPDLPGGWSELLVGFSLDSTSGADMQSAVGLVVGFACEDPTQLCAISVHVGTISVYAAPRSAKHAAPDARVVWGAFEPGAQRFTGTLTWGVGYAFGSAPTFAITDPEDPEPCWLLDGECPGFAYFNVYVHALSATGGVTPSPAEATFVGTTGLDGRENRFYVDPACLPGGIREAEAVRFYIQGVTDRGEVLSWENSAFVDVKTASTSLLA